MGMDDNFASSCDIENNDTPRLQTLTSDKFRAKLTAHCGPPPLSSSHSYLSLALNQARVVIAFSLHWRMRHNVQRYNVDQCKRKIRLHGSENNIPRVFMIFARLAQPSQIALVTPSILSLGESPSPSYLLRANFDDVFVVLQVLFHANRRVFFQSMWMKSRRKNILIAMKTQFTAWREGSQWL